VLLTPIWTRTLFGIPDASAQRPPP
jgi:hypothetical protein